MPHGEASRVEQTIGGGHRDGTDVERRGQLSDGRKLLVGVEDPGVTFDGTRDFGRGCSVN
jgi:hypothetical protein